MSWFKKISQQGLKHFLSKEFLLFVVVGVINTFVGTLFSFLFSKIMAVSLAFWPGYFCGLVVAYVLNSKVTFKKSLSLPKFARFTLSYIPNFVIQYVVLLVVHHWLGQSQLLALLAAAAIGVPVTFLLLKFFTFGSHQKK